MKYTKVQTPRGAKDILPPEGFKKNLIESQAASYVERWGYARVYTPTFEFLDALVQGDDAEIGETLYRFVDRDGHALALRPEMTIPIARMVATRYTPTDMPMRLYYVGNVFRYDEPQAGRQREFTQVGVEFLGAHAAAADAEVVALAVQVLCDLGLRSFRVDLGHIAFIHALLQEIGDEALAALLKHALLERDYVRFESLVRRGDLDKRLSDALLALPTLRGQADVVARARELAAPYPQAISALDDLTAIYELVQAYGIGDRIAIDLGLTKSFDYYTGMLLEGYTPELGFTLCTGGRYDTLIGRFGMECPATGFAFGVERAMLALDRQGSDVAAPVPDVLLYTEEKDPRPLFQAAAAARAEGLAVELSLDTSHADEAHAQAARRGISRVGRVTRQEGGFRVHTTHTDGSPSAGSIENTLAGLS